MDSHDHLDRDYMRAVELDTSPPSFPHDTFTAILECVECGSTTIHVFEDDNMLGPSLRCPSCGALDSLLPAGPS